MDLFEAIDAINRSFQCDLQVTCGMCPVQIEGSLKDGNEVYFRSRGDTFRFTVAPTVMEAVREENVTFYRDGEPDGDAGYLGGDETYFILAMCLSEYEGSGIAAPDTN